ncbi:zinc ribbon domain-containing protein [Streptosporangium sp. NPDC005286]|uniref:zinc ribbon domain-containing protein n=1 Tax=Streptosporangium sp. NPDC005286 TaxID=3154463 RepID=UPI0033B2479F
MLVTEMLKLAPSPEQGQGQGQRADLHSWGFHRLRTFVTYKAVSAGVAVRPVDSRNTSRTCPGGGHIDKRNRPTRDDFRGVSYRLAGLADYFAAINIGRRAVRHAAGDAA